jgi:hypothetical protein
MMYDVTLSWAEAPPAPQPPKIWPGRATRCPAGPRRPDQALRRRDPAAADQDFDIPDEQLVAKINTARMISPTGRQVDIPIENGFVGMVDRKDFDPFLRQRAAKAGADASPAPSCGSSAMAARPCDLSRQGQRQ